MVKEIRDFSIEFCQSHLTNQFQMMPRTTYSIIFTNWAAWKVPALGKNYMAYYGEYVSKSNLLRWSTFLFYQAGKNPVSSIICINF